MLLDIGRKVIKRFYGRFWTAGTGGQWRHWRGENQWELFIYILKGPQNRDLRQISRIRLDTELKKANEFDVWLVLLRCLERRIVEI